MIKLFLIILSMTFICFSFAHADFYQWEDENGNVMITDYPPPSKSIKKLKVHRTESNTDRTAPAPPPRSAASRTIDRPGRAHEVDLYTTRWCPSCRKARDFFTARSIRFNEYDVERDPEAAQRMRRLTPARGVPFAVVNNRSILGFAPDQYKAALEANE